MDKVFHLCCRAVMRKVFAACVVGCLFGCGSKNQAADDTTSADAIKTPATVEQAARVLDLSTFPLMDGARSAESRHVANLSYRRARRSEESLGIPPEGVRRARLERVAEQHHQRRIGQRDVLA